MAGPAGFACQTYSGVYGCYFWIIVVFVYYMLATLLPVDKIIGKIYPLFAIALLFMAVGILVMLLWNHPALPEITDGLHNTHLPDYQFFLSCLFLLLVGQSVAFMPHNLR